MINDPFKRLGFLEALLVDLRDDLGRYGAWSLVPWRILLCIFIGYLPSKSLIEGFWTAPEKGLVFFTAAVTLNGLLLALSIGSFAKIYEIAASPEMSAFLRKNKMLNSYIYVVDYIHYTQIIAILFAGMSLVFCIVAGFPEYLEKHFSITTVRSFLIVGTISSSSYALWNAIGAVRLLQDLVWYSSLLRKNPNERSLTVHDGGVG